ncbi:MAG TPA: membrane protein insertase YidC [Verrucomicrobiae bacterium]|nr:membrane protein insertase YidC [Verrucomicrobiae bacterium]
MTTIENRRFALITALGVVLFLLYQAWQKDFPPRPVATPTAGVAEPAPTDARGITDDFPTPSAAQPASAGEKPIASETPAAAVSRIIVRTDLYDAVILTQGGDLRRLELLGYPVAKKAPDQNIALLDDQGDRWFVVQSGLTSSAGPIASHKDVYRAAAESYVLAEGADRLEVPLTLTDANGRTVTKTYTFHRGSYVVDLTHALANGAGEPVTANAYVQLWRTSFQAGEEPPFTPTFLGVGLYEQKAAGGANYRFRKVSFKDLPEEPVSREQTGGWIALLQHYFVAAVVPPAGEPASFYAKPSATRGYLAQYVGAPHTVAAAGNQAFAVQLYLGPKLQQKLGDIAPGLELVIDYGILTVVAEPLFWLLNWFHKLTGNWGYSIILLTFAVKLAMFKLSEAQYRGMAKMKKYAPRIQEIKERHGDDRERLNKAMMELYKKEKFNPLAGCWPLVIQFPVFIALYWVLLESVELRQADFALWLNDLSSADPYYILPVLFGISMFAQQKLSGAMAMDPMQQRVMNMMPVMLTVFFAFFPVGLVLYWLVSNLIGIAQQWYITRKLTKEGLRQ